MREALSQEGHEVVAVESGSEAISLLNQEDFDCVLLDVRMPP